MKKTEDKIRIIKKYPNRRLYDTRLSRYITLVDIRELVVEGESFQVIDKTTKKDITRTILLQVIADQEEGGDPIFTTEILIRFIRFYGDPMQSSLMSRYLELSLDLFSQESQIFKEKLQRLLDEAHPMQALKELSKGHLPLWRAVRREFLQNLERDRHKSSQKESGKGP